MVEGCFQELESKLVQEYISYFGKLLPFQYLYTDWLAEKLRPLQSDQLHSATKFYARVRKKLEENELMLNWSLP